MWNGVLQPAGRAAEKARITPATCRLSGNPIRLPGRGTVLSADPIVGVAESPTVPDRCSLSVLGHRCRRGAPLDPAELRAHRELNDTPGLNRCRDSACRAPFNCPS